MYVMAKAVNVSIRIDEDVKKASEELFGDLRPFGEILSLQRPDHVEEERTVYVLRFFYGGRDYEKLI